MSRKEEIFCILKNDVEYPALLRTLPDAPAQLYVRGNAQLLGTKCFSVVGSRSATEYARRAIDHIIGPLAPYFTIVSGMALGADALAHRAALAARGPTIAVLGCGVDDASLYPPRHISLAQAILDSGGCLVSEYPPGTAAQPYYFPARNRIVAGLSFGVLIVEATEESGTMITSRLALDYGRDVFAVPGSIFAPLCQGTNRLLTFGAIMTRSADDILHIYGIDRGAQQRKLLLSPDEGVVYKAIESGAESIDQIAMSCNLPLQTIISATTSLELQNKVARDAGRLIIRLK